MRPDIKREKRRKREKTPKQKADRSILGLVYLIVALFLGLMGYVGYFLAVSREDVINNSYNARLDNFSKTVERGKILSSDGTVLAVTEEAEDGSEVRRYPFGPLFSHVVGYSVNGRMGVESQANYYLINSNAPLSEKAGLEVSDEKYPGDCVYTTLDVELQQVASTALGVYRGAIVVTEPSTGKVLAMVSKPDFDPEKIEEQWDEFLADSDSGIP